MTSKYPMPKPHVHAELIKAWADDYKCIEIDYGDGWYSRYNPDFDDVGIKFRIKPNSNYAKAKIAELGGDDLAELYLYWLYGGELVSTFCKQTDYVPKPNQDPFSEFIHILNNYDTITKKKRMVKQVLWVLDENTEKIHSDWFDENFEGGTCGLNKWHKVPTCTREVEVND